MNFQNIPTDIKKNQQFCFWKSIPSSNPTKKAIKKPYGFCSKTKKLVPSLKNPEYWLNWKDALNIIQRLSEEWGLGLVLNGGPYTVIDLDNCILPSKDPDFFKPVRKILTMFQGSYVEISPSGRGLHIVFRGEWPYKHNRGVRPLNIKSNTGTIEVYSGKDCRFITLTGRAFNLHKTHQQQLPSNFQHEMRFLYSKYLEKDVTDSNLLPYKSTPNITEYQSENKNKLLNALNLQYAFESIKQKIQDSSHFDRYLFFCQSNTANYKSTSEADWYFCLFILKFFTEEQANHPEILELFLISERPNREKLKRRDYTHRTVCNALLEAKTKKSIGCSETLSKTSKPKAVNKTDILRVCNAMHIFQLGLSKKNTKISQIIKNHDDNYLEATIPKQLTSKDYDYYIQILEQSAQQINQESLKLVDLKNKHFAVDINIQKILDNLCLTTSGRAYNDFIKSLRKISLVTIQQKKKISNNDYLSEYSGNLLSYFYNKTKKHRKLTVYLNILTVKILFQGQYNYSIFNLNSYRTLSDHRLRLMYYYFCLATLPGGPDVKYTIDQLLKLLWQDSDCIPKETLKTRKRILVSLLENLEKNNHKIADLNIHLKRCNKKIIGISVKKMKMKIE